MSDKPKRPPLTREEARKWGGIRRDRLSRVRAPGVIYDCKLSPYWRFVNLHHQIRETLTRWGLAEFKVLAKGVIMGRLTEEGIEVRDNHHKSIAEKAHVRRLVKNRKKKK